MGNGFDLSVSPYTDCAGGWKHHFAKTGQHWQVLPQGNVFACSGISAGISTVLCLEILIQKHGGLRKMYQAHNTFKIYCCKCTKGTCHFIVHPLG